MSSYDRIWYEYFTAACFCLWIDDTLSSTAAAELYASYDLLLYVLLLLLLRLLALYELTR